MSSKCYGNPCFKIQKEKKCESVGLADSHLLQPTEFSVLGAEASNSPHGIISNKSVGQALILSTPYTCIINLY